MLKNIITTIFFAVIVVVSSTTYRAHFTPAESSGAQGYFDMMIDSNGMATYKWNLNLNYYTLSASLIAAGCTNANFIAQNGLKCKFDFCFSEKIFLSFIYFYCVEI